MKRIAPQYETEPAAKRYLEKKLWPEGPVCPHCASVDQATRLHQASRGESHARDGTYQCRGCRKQFSITVGTIFESSHIPLNKWLLAIDLMCRSEKGVSPLQLKRRLDLGSYRSASFMCRRIRWATKQRPLDELLLAAAKDTQITAK